MSNTKFLGDILTTAGQIDIKEDIRNKLKGKSKDCKLRALEFEKMCKKLENTNEKVGEMIAEMIKEKENRLLRKGSLGNMLEFLTTLTGSVQDCINVVESEIARDVIRNKLQRSDTQMSMENQQKIKPYVGKNVKNKQEISVNA